MSEIVYFQTGYKINDKQMGCQNYFRKYRLLINNIDKSQRPNKQSSDGFPENNR